MREAPDESGDKAADVVSAALDAMYKDSQENLVGYRMVIYAPSATNLRDFVTDLPDGTWLATGLPITHDAMDAEFHAFIKAKPLGAVIWAHMEGQSLIAEAHAPTRGGDDDAQA